MKIVHAEIQNFRKLKSVRIDFGARQTVLVGANNSGKTSAMIALRHFLIDHGRISINDFTISNWAAIDDIGRRWQHKDAEGVPPIPTTDEWLSILPSLDLWITAENNEVHRVRHLIPTLDWTGGKLGVRLRFEPKDIAQLQIEFLRAYEAAEKTRTAIKPRDTGEPFTLWPQSLKEYLDRKLQTRFEVRAFLLDPSKTVEPLHGVARPQALPTDAVPLERDPFEGLILIHGITAHRGLEDAWGSENASHDDGSQPNPDRRRLSEQLRSYYRRHLDPQDAPEPADIEALQAIHDAQRAFDQRLEGGFENALAELQQLNYPGVADPKLKISTRIRPLDGLNHQSAVRYEIPCVADGKSPQQSLRLPEDYNGLGFQNLISIVFRLMSFRDAWLKVGKAAVSATEASVEHDAYPPIHLVLIEEPEAHLHVQVQQVFVKKAYEVLRNHPDLKCSTALSTQMVVSTHSSHVVHECEFDCLRYFRRVTSASPGEVPTIRVVNLSEVFGPGDETAKFVARYLRSAHCELFFADGAILVEGPAERILIPHFIKKWYPELNYRFLTLLEVGGSHAHRLRTLIENLGLLTLVVADLDSVESGSSMSAPPMRGAGQGTGNATLKEWHPKKATVDDLLAVPADEKVLALPDGIATIRFAYQTPMMVTLPAGGAAEECLAITFEDSLIFSNLQHFKDLTDPGMVRKVKKAIDEAQSVAALGKLLFEIVRKGEKAQFALDLLWVDRPRPLVESLSVPPYIDEGLAWLDKMLQPQSIVVPTQTGDAQS